MNEPALFLDGKVTLHCGDCLDALAAMPENSVDSVVTDPPYHLTSIVKRFGAEGAAEAKGGATGAYQRASSGFMGKVWDGGDIAFQPATWAAVLRILKPGGHLVAFSGTRTYHRMAVAIEDAGFEIRDQLAWTYGSGFPKSHDVSKGIDKKRDDQADILRVTTFMADAADAAGISRADVDSHMGTSDMGGWWLSRLVHRCQCPRWEQWLQLKVYLRLPDDMDDEVWRLNGRKGTAGEAWQTAEVVGTGKSAIANSAEKDRYTVGSSKAVEFDLKAANSEASRRWQGWGTALKPAWEPIALGRKPLNGTVAGNVIQFGTGAINVGACRVGGDRFPANLLHDGSEGVLAAFGGEDDGWPTRFFYTAKADSEDRLGSKHPTVKPLDLMQYLCRLVTPPGGIVLDPFAGTGTTGEAAWREGFRAILIEREAEYQADIARRMDLVLKPTKRAAVAKSKNNLQGAEGTPLFGGEAA